MKQLILSAIITLFVFTASAQEYAGQIGTAAKVMANAAADTINITITGPKTAITFHSQVTKNSGTVGGTIVIQTRLTGLAGELWTTLDTHTITDATQQDWVSFTYNQGRYYRVITTTTGTQNSTHDKFLLYR